MIKKSTDSMRKTVKWSLSCKKTEVSKWSHSLLVFFSHSLPFGPGIQQTSSNVSSKNWKTRFLPHESKDRNSFDFFPNKSPNTCAGQGYRWPYDILGDWFRFVLIRLSIAADDINKWNSEKSRNAFSDLPGPGLSLQGPGFGLPRSWIWSPRAWIRPP